VNKLLCERKEGRPAGRPPFKLLNAVAWPRQKKFAILPRICPGSVLTAGRLHGQDKKFAILPFSFLFFAAKRLGNKAWGFEPQGVDVSFSALKGHRKFSIARILMSVATENRRT